MTNDKLSTICLNDVILGLEHSVIEKAKTILNAVEEMDEHKSNHLIYLAWIWSNGAIYLLKDDFLVNVDYELDLKQYDFTGKSFNFKTIFRKYKFQQLEELFLEVYTF